MGEDAGSFEKSAEAYERHVGRYGAGLADALIEFARPHGRALDVGCGPGALTARLARGLGSERVAAVDPSESFVEACRGRLPGVDVRLAPAERLPFDGGAFDAVLSQLVVNFLDDAEAGVAEMRRVARTGGTVAACVWDYAGEMTLLRAFWDAAIDTDPDGATPADEGRRMPFCRPGALEALWREAGLDDVGSAPLVVRARYEDFEDLWRPLPQGVGPSGAYCAALDASGQARLKDALHARLGRPEGPFELDARAWAVRGTAPG